MSRSYQLFHLSFSRYLNAIQTNAHHLLRYLAIAVVVNKRRRNMLKELIKVIQHEQYCYKDPIIEFLECLYVKYDFDGAQQKLMVCEQVSLMLRIWIYAVLFIELRMHYILFLLAEQPFMMWLCESPSANAFYFCNLFHCELKWFSMQPKVYDELYLNCQQGNVMAVELSYITIICCLICCLNNQP